MQSTLIDVSPMFDTYREGMQKVSIFLNSDDYTTAMTQGFKVEAMIHAIIDDILSEGKRWCVTGKKFSEYFEKYFPWYHSPEELERLELAGFKRANILRNPKAIAKIEAVYGVGNLNKVLGIVPVEDEAQFKIQQEFSRLFHDWVLFPIIKKFKDFGYDTMLDINEWSVEGMKGHQHCIVVRSYGDYRIIQYELSERAKAPDDETVRAMGSINTAHYVSDVLGAQGDLEESAPWNPAPHTP